LIGVKGSGKRHALNYIVDILGGETGDTFDHRYSSLDNMTGVEKCRTLWEGYVEQTFEDPIPKWENEVQSLLKRRFPDFF
jgi:hypothetical protein